MPLKEIFNPIEQLCKKTAYRCRHAFVTAQFVCSFVPVCGKSSEKHQCRQQNRREQKNKTRYAAEKGKTDYSECDGKHEHVPRKSVKPVTVFHSFTRFRRSESFLSYIIFLFAFGFAVRIRRTNTDSPVIRRFGSKAAKNRSAGFQL